MVSYDHETSIIAELSLHARREDGLRFVHCVSSSPTSPCPGFRDVCSRRNPRPKDCSAMLGIGQYWRSEYAACDLQSRSKDRRNNWLADLVTTVLPWTDRD